MGVDCRGERNRLRQGTNRRRRVAVEAATLLAPHGVPLVSAGSTTAELDEASNVFRTIYSDSRAADLLVDVVVQRAALTALTPPPTTADAPSEAAAIAILATDDPFGLSGLHVFACANSWGLPGDIPGEAFWPLQHVCACVNLWGLPGDILDEAFWPLRVRVCESVGPPRRHSW